MNENWWITDQDLDDDQQRVIAASPDKDHLIVGPPGSGKTNLLLLRAAYIQRSGFPRFMILAFTRTLREYLVSGASRYGFSGTKIQTSVQWMSDILEEYGLPVPRFNDFNEKREALVKSVQDLIEAKKIQNLFKAILLDEAQDYLPGEVQIYRRLAERIFAVADIRQKIYKGPSPLDLLEGMVDEKHVLKVHYRNGTKICKVADKISRTTDSENTLLGACNYDEKSNPSNVESFQSATIETQSGLIVDRLLTQLKAYPGEYLGVLCATNPDLARVKACFLQSPLAEYFQSDFAGEGFSPDDSPKKIILSTIHGAKGLEFRTLHMVNVDSIESHPKSVRINLCFTAVTRAKTILSVYYSSEMPSYLDQAIRDLSPPPAPPSIKSLFPGGVR